MKEASMIKPFASEMAQRATWEAMQILSGTGYMREHPVERFFWDACLMTMTEGIPEIQQLVIAGGYSSDKYCGNNHFKELMYVHRDTGVWSLPPLIPSQEGGDR